MPEYGYIKHKGKTVHVCLTKIPKYLKKSQWKDKNYVADEILPRTSTKRGLRIVTKTKPKIRIRG